MLFQNIDLHKVALLYKENRLHFAILRRSSNSVTLEGGKQVDEGIYFATPDSDVGHVCYTVVVRFCGGLFGSFFQSVIFGFRETTGDREKTQRGSWISLNTRENKITSKHFRM